MSFCSSMVPHCNSITHQKCHHTSKANAICNILLAVPHTLCLTSHFILSALGSSEWMALGRAQHSKFWMVKFHQVQAMLSSELLRGMILTLSFFLPLTMIWNPGSSQHLFKFTITIFLQTHFLFATSQKGWLNLPVSGTETQTLQPRRQDIFLNLKVCCQYMHHAYHF